ncbi:hypothetical protein QNO07_13880 [Streptomyces sp. 549]|uniref:hypothetical protein n=1 Tax=Streptomyces sp. 549 TaxID=3049076 RepID=UPI0024C32D52|nr:hypothetical protein [Streptomyces sp. 549]MDK1474494.1 hypothetical protein [Streptomyces sp. 549]
MPATAHAPMWPFHVEVLGETVAVTSRIYHDEPQGRVESTLTGTQQVVLHCLYSRHHDGRVRQRHLEQLTASQEPWAVPFVVQLAGEYVLEIIQAITRGLPGLMVPGSPQRVLYGGFIIRNPEFFARTQRRIVSYWSCYHRYRYPVFSAYPGSALAEALRSAAAEQSGARWPRHTPRAVDPGVR